MYRIEPVYHKLCGTPQVPSEVSRISPINAIIECFYDHEGNIACFMQLSTGKHVIYLYLQVVVPKNELLTLKYEDV